MLAILAFLLGLASVPAHGDVFPRKSRATDTGQHTRTCKTAPGSPEWPSEETWARFNQSVGGRLLRPTPPGAVCHTRLPVYDADQCAAVAAGWTTYDFHQNDPISSMWQQYNNDTCLPNPDTPCSPDGYPASVVNATSASDIKLSLEFARTHNIRVIVKSTGHDYQGRSQAPGALSIWIHHLRGLKTHTSFTPQGCNFTIDGPAVTVAGGSQMIDIYDELGKINQTVVGGTGRSVGIGGYITGGGHSILAPHYGLGADQALEMEVVTPMGDIIVANECENQDLFWAMRGGGGSTFGIVSSVTLTTHPSPQMVGLDIGIFTRNLSATYLWDMMGYLLSQYPYLDSKGLSGYGYFFRNFSLPDGDGGTIDAAGMGASFAILNTHDTADMLSIWAPVLGHINTTWPDVTILPGLGSYSSFQDWFSTHYDQSTTGDNIWIGSHLLDSQALIRNNATVLGEAFKIFDGSAFLVAGRGVKNAKPRGGSISVHPSWRRALVHSATGLSFPPLNLTARAETLADVNAMTEPLRRLAPNMGAYVNENNPGEPDWQHAFWGENYDRLFRIKREVDPLDVLWCHPCVGNERWKEDGYQLCRVNDP
ncbi:hypothetical protein AAE478_008702 [Parahypoxylon ruwenzoriense]